METENPAYFIRFLATLREKREQKYVSIQLTVPKVIREGWSLHAGDILDLGVIMIKRKEEKAKK